MKHLLTTTIFSFGIIFSSFHQKEEWVSLFNGKNLDGWTVKCKPEDKDKTFWTVKDGYIEVNSMGDKDHDYVWLMTEREYENFVLKLKFAAFKESPGNSGVQFRSRYDEEKWWLDGPQIDIHPQGPWRSGMIWDETRDMKRWIYPDIPKGEWVNESMREKVPDIYYSDDELRWNEMEIIVEGWKVTAFLNGTQITDFNNKELLTGPGHKKFKVGKKGHICLQLHINDELKMRYKDILIMEL
jgi:hypothetical protein